MYELFMQHCCNGRISANTEDKQQKQMPQTYNLAATKNYASLEVFLNACSEDEGWGAGGNNE